MADAPRRVALYARVSTAEQDAEAQLLRLRSWAHLQGFEIALEKTDVASGRLPTRSGLDEVMGAARGHHVHAVAVAKVDRWARSVRHMSSSIHELHGLSVDFTAVDQGLTVRRGEPTGTLILNVLGAVAEWEASIISERTKEALRAKPPGEGAGRHRRGCGVEFRCPTNHHCKQCGLNCRQVGGALDCPGNPPGPSR
jgi:DNA invertase Pin-like site-specific DNA recombinase